MPVERTMVDSMLGTFRTMFKDCADKKMSGPSFDALEAVMARMEALAREMDDFGAFSAKLMTEGCFNEFSAQYSRLLAEAARAEQRGGGGAEGDEDARLLRQTLAAYQAAIDRYDRDEKSGAMKPETAASLRAAVQAVVDLGKSGLSYPVFLRQLIEKGLDRAMEGKAVLRSGLLSACEWAAIYKLPLHIKMNEEILGTYDAMASKAAFGVPDSFAFGLARAEVEWKHAPAIARWTAIKERWERVLDLVNDWVDAHASFAPRDDRWVAQAGMADTKRNIKRTRDLNPFRLRERERLLKEAFDLSWDDIFAHETYLNAWERVDVMLSARKVELLKKARALCIPGGEPSAEMVEEAEALHDSKADYRHAEREAVGAEMRRRYDAAFGAGAYERAFDK